MTISVAASLNLALVAKEITDTATSPSSTSGGQGATRIYDALAKLLNYDSASYPPVNGRVADLYTVMASSPIDIDLTAIQSSADISKTVDLTGKKLVAGALWAPKANTAGIVISCPANGYELFGSASDRVTLLPGKRLCWGLDGELASGYANPEVAVSGTHKLIRLTDATVTDKLYGLLLFGT